MFLILGLFLLQPCCSLALDLPEVHETILTPELERLTKILPLSITKTPEVFYADFHTDAARLNVSIDSYANACFDMYLSMQLSPAESAVEKEVFRALYNDPDVDLKQTILTPELERLTKILPLSITKTPEVFYADFHTDAARLNVSIDSYANACFDMYLSMQLSPAESAVEKEVFRALYNDPDVDLKQIAATWKKSLPLTYSALKFRKNALNRLLATKPLDPPTAKFVGDVVTSIEPYFIKFILSSNSARMNVLETEITKIALAYKKLSVGSKRSLEHTLCFSNTIKWINATVGMHERRLFARFWEVVGLDVDGLLMESDFHCSLAIDQVKGVVEKRAVAVGMAPQDYADICTETLRSMKLSQEEKEMFDLRSEDFMGSEWGHDIFNSTNEMFEALQNESVPFNRLLSKGNRFVDGKLSHLTPNIRELVQKVREEFSHTLVAVNNQLSANQTSDKIRLLSNETASLFEKEEVIAITRGEGIFFGRQNRAILIRLVGTMDNWV